VTKSPDLQPTLTGEHVIVRPVQVSDWEGMFAAASDPKIWALHPESDRYQEAVFRKYFDGAVASGSAFTFVDKKSGNIIGSSRYWGFNADKSEIEIGWTFLARDYWGGSYNAEIKKLMLDHAFSFVETVVFWIGESNVRSRRATEKIGAVLRGGVQHRGDAEEDPHVVYEISKNSPLM
jgi:RimJ/RimL family protein N-acetyltransferase